MLQSIRASYKKLFSFKANGEQLLTKKSDQWLTIARIIVLILASFEGLSWGYFGSLLGWSKDKYVFALLFGLFAFFVVWAVDASLMTLDRGKTYYDKIIYNYTTEEAKGLIKKIQRLFAKHEVEIGVVTRIVMISVSIYITAPFLNQLVFNREINIRIKNAATSIIGDKRQQLDERYDSLIRKQETSLAYLDSSLAKELAGKGLSGRYGFGIVAKELQGAKGRTAQLLDSTRKEKTNVLAAFDAFVALGDYGRLSEKWGITVPQNSLGERSKAIRPVLESGDARRFELAIRSFLGFLFLALVLLKVYEPRGIRIYLSDALQQAYATYKSGGYDRWIRAEEKCKGSSPMQPYRFEEFMIHTYPAMMQDKRQNEKKEQFEEQLEQVKDYLDRLEEEKAREERKIHTQQSGLQSQYTDIQGRLNDYQNRLSVLECELILHNADIEECTESIKQLGRLIEESKVIPDGFERRVLVEGHFLTLREEKNKKEIAIRRRGDCEKMKAELNRFLQDQGQQLQTLKQQLEVLEFPLLTVVNQINNFRSTLAKMHSKRLDEILQKMEEEE